MDRLCGRPGCSERASVAYGMRAEDLVFWLDRLPGGRDTGGGVLCLRHADSMVVPRGWTLDDLRQPDLHLFRPPPASEPPPRRPRRRTERSDVGEQLQFGTDPLSSAHEASSATDADPDAATEPEVWSPAFDEADDLDGLLSAHSPLLARAFRTAERPRG